MSKRINDCQHNVVVVEGPHNGDYRAACCVCGLSGQRMTTEAEARADFWVRAKAGDMAGDMKVLLEQLAFSPQILVQLSGDGAVLAVKARDLLEELKEQDND